MTTFGWVFASSGTAIFAADFLTAFGQLVSDTYEATSWQLFLLIITALTVTFVLNTLFIKIVPNLTSFMVIFFEYCSLIYLHYLARCRSPKSISKESIH